MDTRRLLLLAAMAAVMLQGLAGHRLIDGVLEQSAIFPGTTHAFQVYVPDGYNGKRDAALYVGLDGVLCHAPQVMDSLIEAKKMPITIGVFLQPGVITAEDGTVLRYNRCYEFDSTTGDFAAFLERELLPAVEQLAAGNGIAVRLSCRPQDRMIAGLSSGGIAAFNAAWHRPDLFGKVFSGVGTFVAMRGGNDLQALVRKTEPLPLRVYLQDGSNDVWNPLFGHWFEGNKLMASALEFAGCDLMCDWSDGGHNVTRATAIFPKMMEWMWRDWPAAPTTGTTQNDFLQAMLSAGDKGWKIVAGGVERSPVTRIVYPDLTSVAMIPAQGGNVVWQYLLQGGQLTCGDPYYWLHNDDASRPLQVTSIAWDGAGNLWAATSIGLQVCDQNGRVRAIVRLPQGCTSVNEIIIENGRVTLSTATATWQRQFNVTAPIPGVRPASQGQG